MAYISDVTWIQQTQPRKDDYAFYEGSQMFNVSLTQTQLGPIVIDVSTPIEGIAIFGSQIYKLLDHRLRQRH